MRRTLGTLVVGAALGFAVPALAREDGHGEHTAEHGDHAASEKGAHGGGHGEHVPSFDEINWYYGMVGEKEDVEPSLLFRPKGMPAPFGALLLNTAILYFILYRLFKKPIAEGLASRKNTILKGMEEAARMKREAEAQLQHYEEKLASIDEQVGREMRAAGETERARVLNEARERRTRMERDAQLLIAQELKAVREQLLHETVESAIRSAERMVRERLDANAQQSIAEQHLFDLKAAASSLRGRV
jgi:F-type H+-transporting ATPase subunit b